MTNIKSSQPVITHIVIVDKMLGVTLPQPNRLILTPADYIAHNYPDDARLSPRVKVINLCSDYSYLKTGYYCSILADARGHRCTPAISDVIHAQWKRLHADRFGELAALLSDAEARAALGDAPYLDIYFGRTAHPDLQGFSRAAFDAFRLPAMRVELAQKPSGVKITSIEPLTLSDLRHDSVAFNAALDEFSGANWEEPIKAKPERYWLAILHNPQEANPPSDQAALQNFIRVGQSMGFYVELITRANFDSLLEFDALFIRETTAVNNHTYRFAEKALREGLAVMDDPVSILRCCNKVYLQDMLREHNIPTPRGEFLYRRGAALPKLAPRDFPRVLKVPDGAFSLGVFKVDNQAEFEAKAEHMFKSTEIILMQDFAKSGFDWRVVTLGGKILFACRYHMAGGHWQIYNHAAEQDGEGHKYGRVECVAVADIPAPIAQTALQAAGLIGTGLYGVDLKEIDGAPLVIEVNDNPNIDAGFEDQLLGDALYAAIFDHFKILIDSDE